MKRKGVKSAVTSQTRRHSKSRPQVWGGGKGFLLMASRTQESEQGMRGDEFEDGNSRNTREEKDWVTLRHEIKKQTP